ncbi:MAG: FmdB family zinc ribbon protein [Burkholderiales bacterium]
MPIYEYRCEKCGYEKEFLQKVSDAPISTCPACGESAMTKLISAAGFQLKGSGWYATDFKNSGGSKSATAKSESSEKPAETATAGGGCGNGPCPACT